jgi:vancomycin permeability regulator SanA
MIRGFFDLIFRLLSLLILIFIATAIWIVFDGLNDHGDRASVAVVPGTAILRDGLPGPILRARLDRAIELYQAGKFPLIIVSGATKLGGYDEPSVMANYLVEHEVPRTAIIQDKLGANTNDTGMDVAKIMATRRLQSAMIVSNYYHITRLKLALQHAGVHDVQQMHVGVVNKDDAFMLGREVVALYYYLGRFYLIPAAEKARSEAEVAGKEIKKDAEKTSDKASQDADAAKKKVNDGLDSLKK